MTIRISSEKTTSSYKPVGTIFSPAYAKKIMYMGSRTSRRQNGIENQSITKYGRNKQRFMEEERQ